MPPTMPTGKIAGLNRYGKSNTCADSTQPMAMAPTPAINPAKPPTINTSAYCV